MVNLLLNRSIPWNGLAAFTKKERMGGSSARVEDTEEDTAEDYGECPKK